MYSKLEIKTFGLGSTFGEIFVCSSSVIICSVVALENTFPSQHYLGCTELNLKPSISTHSRRRTRL